MATHKLLVMTDDMVPGYLSLNEGRLLNGLASMLPPSSLCVEIGTFCGKSTRWLTVGTLISDSGLYCIDPFTSELGVETKANPTSLLNRFFEQDTLGVAMWSLLKLFNEPAMLQHVEFYRGTSKAAEKAWLGEGIDLLFIDGNHEECQEDVDRWLSHVQPWGMLAFHDVTTTKSYGVNGPINTVQRLLATRQWRVYAQTESLVCLTRDSEWWAVRGDATYDRYTAGFPRDAQRSSETTRDAHTHGDLSVRYGDQSLDVGREGV